MMRRTRCLPLIFGIMGLVMFGLVGSVQGKALEYVVLTAFTDTRETTWAPQVILVDLDVTGNSKEIMLRLNFGKSLENALVHAEHNPLRGKDAQAFASGCKVHIDMLRWAMNSLWDPNLTLPEDRASVYAELASIVNHEIYPDMQAMVGEMGLTRVGRHVALKRNIKRLHAIQDIITTMSVPRI